MKLSLPFLVLVAVISGFAGGWLASPSGSAPAAAKETAFERVMRTGILRCGYYVFPPVTKRDEATGEMTGLAVDMMQLIAEKSSLKVEWAEEVTFGNWGATLQAGRVDAICTPMWPDVAMSRVALFTGSLWYAGISPLVKANDTRFADDLERLNREDITFVTQEGNVIDFLTRQAFPKAGISAIAPSADGAQAVQEILTGKADALLTDRNAETEYNRTSSVPLRLVDRNHPVKYQPFTLVTGTDAPLLRDFLDSAIDDLINSGSINRLLDKWDQKPATFMRISRNAAYPVQP